MSSSSTFGTLTISFSAGTFDICPSLGPSFRDPISATSRDIKSRANEESVVSRTAQQTLRTNPITKILFASSPKQVAVFHAAGHSLRDMSRKLRHGPRSLAVPPSERKSENSRQSLPSERKPRGSGASPPALLPVVDLWIKAHPRKPCVTLLSPVLSVKLSQRFCNPAREEWIHRAWHPRSRMVPFWRSRASGMRVLWRSLPTGS
jgi:hypothetical protein